MAIPRFKFCMLVGISYRGSNLFPSGSLMTKLLNLISSETNAVRIRFTLYEYKMTFQQDSNELSSSHRNLLPTFGEPRIPNFP